MKKTRRDFLKVAGASAVGAGALMAGRKKAHAAEKPIKWRFQSIHGSGQDSYKLCQEFVNNVKTATNGRLVIDMYPNGGIVEQHGRLPACSEGIVEMHESWPLYQGAQQCVHDVGRWEYVPPGVGSVGLDLRRRGV